MELTFDGTHASLAAHIANQAMAIVGAGQAIDVSGQITGEMAFADWEGFTIGKLMET